MILTMNFSMINKTQKSSEIWLEEVQKLVKLGNGKTLNKMFNYKKRNRPG